MTITLLASTLTSDVNRTEILLDLPNPFTPMAFLDPDLAWQYTVAIYWIVGSLAVLVWDIISNLHNDFILLTKHRINLSMGFYCLSRLSCLAYLAFLTVLQTAPVGNCALVHQIQVLYTIVIPSTSLLFLVRVSALYYNNKFVIAFFILSWLGVLGGCITPTQGVHATRIGLSNFCINGKVEGYVALAGLLPLINDTLVFCATSFALLRNSYVEGVGNGFRVLLFGNYLPAFSKAILKDGQVYYLCTIGLNLTTIVMIYTPGLPIVYANFLGVPNIVLTNILACLVYRKVRFGVFREKAMNPTVSRTFGASDRMDSTMPKFQRRTITLKFNQADPEHLAGSADLPTPIEIMKMDGKHDQEKIEMDQLGQSRSDILGSTSTTMEDHPNTKHAVVV